MIRIFSLICALAVGGSAIAQDHLPKEYELNQSRIRRSGLSGLELQEVVDAVSEKGFVPTFLGAQSRPGEATTFSEVFESVEVQAWDSRIGLSDAEFLARDKQFLTAGYTLVSHDRYSEEGYQRHAAIWHQRNQPSPTRETFTGKNRHIFMHILGDQWIEIQANGRINGLTEVSRETDFLELHDRDRKLLFRIYQEQITWSFVGKDWKHWPDADGKWNVRPAAGRSAVTEDQLNRLESTPPMREPLEELPAEPKDPPPPPEK